jgi:adenylate cyclase
MEATELPAAATRELAAIMFSDVVGYTAIMGRDEREGLRAVREHRAHLRAVLPKFNGRLIGEIGDGTLSSFHSAVDAVNCARELQAALVDDPELRLRIGIHVGDVVFTDNTVLGDGVNIASRLNAIAAPGGVCISERVYEDIRNKPEIKVTDLGEQRLKNVSRPIRAYEIVAGVGAQRSQASSGRRRIALIAGAGAVVLAGIALALVRPRSPAPALPPPPPQAAVRHAISSIAVLPLDNFSGDPKQEYFADGMTDELTTDLAKISALRVISRGSVMRYKGAGRPPTPEIAKALNVDAVVEGSVMKSGDKVRITAQLIDARNDRHLWADSYERDTRDVLALQDEVALAIAREVNVELTPHEQARFANARPVNSQAYEAYLKGRYFLSEFSGERLKKAVEQFELAIKLDPNFALPYTGLSDAYSWAKLVVPPTEVMPKAKAAAEKALQLDDSLAEAHTSLAIIKFTYEFDWAGGEREFRRAIELNPSYAYAHNQYGALMFAQGRFDEALAEQRRASELDPLSVEITNEVAWPLMGQGKYQTAKEQIRKALELDPSDLLAHWNLGYIDIQAGKFNDAIPELEKVQAMNSSFPPCYLGYAYAAVGERAKAEAALAEVRQVSSRQYLSPMCSARIYVGLGDKRQALDELEKAYDDRSSNLPWLKVDKTWDPLRSEPRFIALLKKVGLDK